MRMSDEEHRRLEALAAHFGINGAGVIRMMMMERARELGLESAAPAKKPGKAAKR
ncbi:MAG: hypothetical protein U0235_28350 [Polyangiaceae bacterium]